MIGIDLIGVGAPAQPAARNLIDSSENIYNANPIVPNRHAPAPTTATSYYPERPGFVEDTRKPDVNRDFGMNDYVPQWDSSEQAELSGIVVETGTPTWKIAGVVLAVLGAGYLVYRKVT